MSEAGACCLIKVQQGETEELLHGIWGLIKSFLTIGIAMGNRTLDHSSMPKYTTGTPIVSMGTGIAKGAKEDSWKGRCKPAS